MAKPPQPYPSNLSLVSPTVPMQPMGSGLPRPWQVGPCFNCLEMGHLKAHCPKINRKYPLSQLNNSCVDSSVDTVCDCSVSCDNSYSHVCKGSKAASKVDEEGRPGPSSNDIAACTSEHAESPEPLELCRYWELEHDTNQITDVQGRLKDNVSFWREILQAPQPIVDSITDRYKLPLLTTPPQFSRPNHNSSLDNAYIVEAALAELLANRCVRVVADPLSVVINRAGKKHL